MAQRFAAKLTLDGHKELSALLKELPRRVVKKGLRAAISAAATPIAKAVRAGARSHNRTGSMAKAIDKKVKTYPSGNVVAVIGAKKDFAVNDKKHGGKSTGQIIPYYYLHLIEGGVKPHSLKGDRNASKSERKAFGRDRDTANALAAKLGLKSDHPGFAGDPFVARAFEAHKAEAVSIAEAKLKESVEKEAESLGRK